MEKAVAWANNKFFDDNSRKEIQKLIEEKNSKEIIDRFYRDLEFGTGGIRGIIGQGINRINKYTIMKATQALAIELKRSFKGKIAVSIGFDSRHFSTEFSKITASVLAANDIHAYLFKNLNPVCLLSYSVRYHKAQAGVMITASHNPPEYNGYKVYWNDGRQVTPPNDENIIKWYNDISDFSAIKLMDFSAAEKKGYIHWVEEDVVEKYLEFIKTKAINPKMCKEQGSKLKFIYTPLHGTGLVPCTAALKNLGLTNFLVVEAQAKPDGRFPTVKSPNPENAEALALAVELMRKSGGEIAFGTDPDADRVGVALLHKNEVHYLSGNQIGSLMLHYIVSNLAERSELPTKPYCVKTIVTTNLQTKIAEHYKVKIENTLTGFKWICGVVGEIENKKDGSNFIFGTEESFGYLNHDQVRDKDGVAPVALLAEMALFYKLKGMTLIDALDSLYEKFGFHDETLLNLNYLGAEGAAKIVRIMDHFRAFELDSLSGEKIIETEDYQSSKIKNLKSGKVTTINLPQSNVLGFVFENGSKLYLRPSGTEPKIKFYLLLAEKSGSLQENKIKAKEKSKNMMSFIKTECEKI